MRVTQSQLQSLALNGVIDARSRLLDAQKIASTGQAVARPSDDPAAAARIRLIESLTSESTRHLENIDLGRLRLQRSEQGLSEAGNLLVRAKELALAMSNDTLDGGQRALAAEEVRQLRASVLDIINTKDGKEFVYASVNTTSPPVDAAGNFNYDVDLYDGVREIEIGPTARGEIGASASAAFAARAIVPGSVDVLAVLDTLAQNLDADDPSAVRADVDTITSAFEQVLAERTRVGLRVNRLDSAESAARQSRELYRGLHSDLSDADAAEAFSKLSLAETSLQAAVSVASRVLGPSLLDAL